MKARMVHVEIEGNDETIAQAVRSVLALVTPETPGIVRVPVVEQLPAPAVEPAPPAEPKKPGRSPESVAKQRATLAARRGDSAISRLVNGNGVSPAASGKRVWTPEQRAKFQASMAKRRAVDNGDAKPRHSGQSMPLNPHFSGRGA